ncbi:acyl-CoA dehydratase activase [Chloroflexota bacterium]
MVAAGIDSGLSSTKVVVLREGNVLAEVVVRADVESAAQLAERSLELAISQAMLSRQDIQYIVACGRSGHYIPFANEVIPEFMCLTRGIGRILPSVRTILDIGAEKSLAVKCSQGKAINMAKNDKCAAGTGTYLDMVSKLLAVPIDRMGELSLHSKQEVEVASTCAIFAESEIISLLHSKNEPQDILRGVYHGLAVRIYPLLAQVGIQKDVAMVGGLALDIGMRKAVEQQLGLEVSIPDNPLVVNAMGAAVLAEEKMRSSL